MKYRMLGTSGIRVSEIGFGTWGLGGVAYGPVSDEQAKSALRLAFEQGVTFFDTADLYGDGKSETLLGEVFKSSRQQVVIATKGGSLPHTTFVMPQDFSAAYITKALEASLQRLQTDYVDLYLLHSPQMGEIRKQDGLVRTLEQFKRRGLVKEYGLSSRSPQDALDGIKEFGFRVVEVNFNIIDHRALDNGLFGLAAQEGVGVIVRTPLAFGYLSGRLSGKEALAKGDHRNNWPREQLERWAKSLEHFSFIVDDTSRTPAQAALRFCLDFDAVSTAIPGMMSAQEVLEDCRASDVRPFTQQEIARIREIYSANVYYDKTIKEGQTK